MDHHDSQDHGPGQTLARSELGCVSACRCGIVTLTLQYLSVRLEAVAFRELHGLVSEAQGRLDEQAAAAAAAAPRAADAPMH